MAEKFPNPTDEETKNQVEDLCEEQEETPLPGYIAEKFINISDGFGSAPNGKKVTMDSHFKNAKNDTEKTIAAIADSIGKYYEGVADFEQEEKKANALTIMHRIRDIIVESKDPSTRAPVISRIEMVEAIVNITRGQLWDRVIRRNRDPDSDPSSMRSLILVEVNKRRGEIESNMAGIGAEIALASYFEKNNWEVHWSDTEQDGRGVDFFIHNKGKGKAFAVDAKYYDPSYSDSIVEDRGALVDFEGREFKHIEIRVPGKHIDNNFEIIENRRLKGKPTTFASALELGLGNF